MKHPKSGFKIVSINPIRAIAHPHDHYWNPCPGNIIGLEMNEQFGDVRFIFKYDKPRTSKRHQGLAHFPKGEMYMQEQDLAFESEELKQKEIKTYIYREMLNVRAGTE